MVNTVEFPAMASSLARQPLFPLLHNRGEIVFYARLCNNRGWRARLHGQVCRILGFKRWLPPLFTMTTHYRILDIIIILLLQYVCMCSMQKLAICNLIIYSNLGNNALLK